MENQTFQYQAHFSDLTLGDKVRAGVIIGVVALVLMVLAALGVNYYHWWKGARARHTHAVDEEMRASEAQLSAAHLAASQARTQELELELAAAQQRASSLQSQLAELERRWRQCHSISEELAHERRKISVLERKLSVTEQARDLEKEAQQTTYAMYQVKVREVEELERLLAEQQDLDVHTPPPMLAAAPVLRVPEGDETDYFSAE